MNTKEFIDFISNDIVTVAKKYGYEYPSAIIAQAIVESNNGNSLLSKKYFNYFGLKCGSSWKGKSINLRTKEEYEKGVITNIRDNFRVYENRLEGVRGYFEFIQYNRYANIRKATSSRDYLVRIKRCGYATSYNYVSVVYNVVKNYNLERFDNMKVEDFKTDKLLTGDEILTILADDVIKGKYGNGKERIKKLGKLYSLVQNRVNELVNK